MANIRAYAPPAFRTAWTALYPSWDHDVATAVFPTAYTPPALVAGVRVPWLALQISTPNVQRLAVNGLDGWNHLLTVDLFLPYPEHDPTELEDYGKDIHRALYAIEWPANALAEAIDFRTLPALTDDGYSQGRGSITVKDLIVLGST